MANTVHRDASDLPFAGTMSIWNPRSRSGAIDVNQDGQLDIVSGGWWYEAPAWKKHFLRTVEEIRGRYDDYSNLPLDVNGDGRLDIISANYRSESIFWIENPGPDGGEWTTHRVTTPGPMETGRLFDIDGDGQLDLLPAGVKFSAWWSIDPAAASDGERWTRHELPPQVTGHGIGFGDVDGDGRSDIVGVHGWAKAPENRRTGTWEWQPEFVLHRDASVPILVYDVDGDGDTDIVWGRGHQTGLYWLEQKTDADDPGNSVTSATRSWEMHAIDTEWSQLHSPLLADLDNDGRPELIAAKRYLGHDGRDIGEYDPMVVLAYQFDPQERVWNRTILDWGSRAGFDLDPKAVDLDGDGDLDLLCPTRGGLCVLENLHINTNSASATNNEYRQPVDYPDHTNVTVLRSSAGEERAIGSPDDWGLRRAQILANMQHVMGPLPGPEMRVPLDAEYGDEILDQGTYTRRRVTFASAPGERVIAWLLQPKERTERGPAMLCLHQTVPIGKDEPVGLGGKPNLRYAQELAERGYVCLAPDYPSFGEDHFDFEGAADRWKSGSMKAIWNNLRSVDFLETLPEVDPDRIGVIGHSLGGHNSLFTAAFDQRLRAVVTSCGFTEFHQYYGGDLKGWTSLRYMPRIAAEYRNDPDRVPFDFQEVLGAIAPRPIFINAPIGDGNFEINGVRAVVAAIEPVYDRMRFRDWQRVRLETPDVGHDFPTDVREQAYTWLDKVLK
ncbi:MAG: alpha/beta fold hydrolase [Planctomycetaceae bacterium]|nr:alpha/beta fold hydrolase [Planctomycetaceae bacterium]